MLAVSLCWLSAAHCAEAESASNAVESSTEATASSPEKLLATMAEELNMLLFSLPHQTMFTEYPLTQAVTGRQIETFDQPFKKTPAGVYESTHVVKTMYFGAGKPSDRSERGTLRMLAQAGEVLLYATYDNSNGTSQSYGPWAVERSGTGVAFVDRNAAPAMFEKWVIYRTLDGKLAAERRFRGGMPEPNYWTELVTAAGGQPAEAAIDAARDKSLP